MYLSLRSTTGDLFLEGLDLLFKVLVDLMLDLGIPVHVKYDNARKDEEADKANVRGLAKKRSRTLELRNALSASRGGGISEEDHGGKRWLI